MTTKEAQPTDAAVELLPCPFCGCKADMIRENGEYWVRCQGFSCFGCVFARIGNRPFLYGYGDVGFRYKEDAIRRWNTRAAKAEPPWNPISDDNSLPKVEDTYWWTHKNGKTVYARFDPKSPSQKRRMLEFCIAWKPIQKPQPYNGGSL
jgi:hypothetical protein